ncbi:MAG: prepilin peptidase [Betaproteobacteria bacterium]|nr:prepilin peptidase [Betaproteobacteria bacterium]
MCTGCVLGAAFLGLFLGSALNMLVRRLPFYMQLQWDVQSQQANAHTAMTAESANAALARPHCPQCKQALQTVDLVPILSFVLLHGRCRYCAQPLSWRYPLVEALTAALLAACVGVWGVSWQAIAAGFFSSSLLALALIDWESSLLPDAITQPLVWAGLIVSALQISRVPLQQSLAGAVLGYLFFWFIYWVFKLITGKEGMGYGDFKLTAALGAWLGVGALLPLILIATLTGAAFGLIQKLRGALGEQGHFSFGPFLSLAGVIVLFGGS